MADMREEKREHKPVLPEETREHLRAARQEWRKSVESLFPPGFLEHRRAARREMLKAARSLIDYTLRRLEEDDEPARPSETVV
jgi:hypothetical protein